MSYQPHFTVDDVMVRAQPTPNPYAIKFVANHAFKASGKATITHPSELGDSKLVESLFQVPGVKQLYLHQNTLTVNHEGAMEFEALADQIEGVIKTRLPIHDPHFQFDDEVDEAKTNTPKDRSQLSEEMREIEEILDRTIRPGLQADGGDLEVLELKDNELKILYMGACGGCPSAMMGTLDAIQNILRHELGNDSLKVRPV